ncbi:MAG TPA: hypothetical protein VFB58_06420 [Chloroflexota bacterium]|nr:hypothetical protein [Chloroflexota bacterium]
MVVLDALLEPARGISVPAFAQWVFPEFDLAVIIASTHDGTGGRHEQTGRVLTDFVLPGV